MLLLAPCLLISALAASCSGPTASKCKDGECDMIGKTEVCTQCKTETDHLIDGECVPAGTDQAAAKCASPAQGKCGSCGDGYFMYKGGCYEFAGELGGLICADPVGGAASDKVIGVCKDCVEGFFKSPVAAANKQSCISCNDTTGADQYQGVDQCKTCTPPSNTGPATCTACDEGYFGAGTTTCTACGDENCATCTEATTTKKCSKCKATGKMYLKKESGSLTGICVEGNQCSTDSTLYPDDTEPKSCKPCTAGTFENCKTCTKSDTSVTCTACKANMVFGLGKKSCISSCPDNSEAKTENTCTCNDGFKLNEEETQCVPNDSPSNPCNTQDCKACSGAQTNKEICTECLSNKYLAPTSQCIDHCEYILGYYSSTEGNKRVCKKCEVANCLACSENGGCGLCKDGFYGEACSPCDSSCKTCSGNTANDCTSCKSGSALTYGSTGNTGTCGAECAAGTGTGKCRECGLTVEGTKYCSVCSQNNEYPQNGVCAVKVSRTDKCKDGSITGGVCNVCADGFFKMNGGCYSTSQLPGSTVCLSAQSTGGTCKTPKEGFSLTGESLVACYTGCAECTTTKDCSRCMDGYVKVGSACTKCHESCYTCEAGATTCKVCAPGYYKESSSNGLCKRCSEGLAGCRQCATPVNGKFICFETDDNTGDNTGGSTNKSGLSMGAIAGISVAVIVVVGGLVGFLCWWFLCRGKA
ncbi:VSP [Giardia duodenalis]|uniref:VSP n=1 Tax=Giardia intestinalis (strain ATCC 50803 / WB clone C6) TaxID=184922 RepID=A0A644F3W3_GIAIC|nr:VSP [Giardia intestinalis]KAE8303324.1 VSP [Giardia intestinalis]